MKKIIARIRYRIEQMPLGDTILHSFNYFTKTVATQGISLISIPIFTYYLSTEDYGILNIFTSYIAIASVLLTLNTQVGIGRYYFEDQNDFGSLLFMCIVFPFTLLGIAFLVLLVFQEKVATLLSLPVNTIVFIVPSVLVLITGNYVLQVFRSQKKSIVIRNYSIHKTYFSFLATLAILYFMKEEKYLARLWGDLVVLLVFSVYTFYLLKPYITYKLKKVHLSYLLSFSIPLIPAYLSTHLLSYFDRILINGYLGPSSAGLYSFAYNISSLQIMIFTALTYAWDPEFYVLMKNKNYVKHDSDVTKLSRLIAIGSCVLVLFADQIGKLLGSPKYHEGLVLIPIIVLGQYFLSVNYFYKNQISYAKKNWIASVVILITTLVNIGLNLILIPEFGMIAAAFTTLISYVLQAFLMFLAIKYILKPEHYLNPAKLVDSIAVIFIATALYYLIREMNLNLWADLYLKLVILFGFVATFYHKHLLNALIWVRKK